MAWRETLNELRDELAEVRAQRQARAAEEEAQLNADRNQIMSLADSLEISALLSEMSSTLVQGRGEVQRSNSWEADIDPDDEDITEVLDEDADLDAVTTVLSWDEAGDQREIAVEVVAAEDGISLQVNGVAIRPEREALEQALVEAFRDELEL